MPVKLHPLIQRTKIELVRLDKLSNLSWEEQKNFNSEFLPISVEPKLRPRALRSLNDIYSGCDDNLDLASNSSTLSTLSCLKRVNTELDILERKISNYSTNGNSKVFNVIKTNKKTVSYSSIKSIKNINGKTAVEFEYVSPYVEGGWISINSETYLYDIANKRNLKLLSVSGIEYSPKRKIVHHNELITFRLFFEQLPPSTKKISIIECDSNSCFNFYGVEIN